MLSPTPPCPHLVGPVVVVVQVVLYVDVHVRLILVQGEEGAWLAVKEADEGRSAQPDIRQPGRAGAQE